MEFLKKICEFVWAESFWLPGNVTWKDLESLDGNYYPHVNDLIFVFPFAAVILFVRYLFERFIGLRIGRYYKMREQSRKKAVHNNVLEHVFNNSKETSKISSYQFQSLMDDTQMTQKEIERWWRRRKTHDKPTEMQRFTETSWRLVYYFVVFWYGFYIIHDKPWFKDTKECWYGFPKQHVETEIWIYYMTELGFYVSLIFSLCTDIRRKDFWQMMIHHYVTILLMVMSWCNNMVRVGSLILCLHDVVDWWLEGAKLANYVHYEKLCDSLFVMFAFLWFVTRLVIFPLWILNTTYYENRMILGEFVACYMFNVLLFTLLILHFVWFCTILNMAYKFIAKGKVEKDSRSDTESETNSESDTFDNIDIKNDKNNNPLLRSKNVRLRHAIKNLQEEFMPSEKNENISSIIDKKKCS